MAGEPTHVHHLEQLTTDFFRSLIDTSKKSMHCKDISKWWEKRLQKKQMTWILQSNITSTIVRLIHWKKCSYEWPGKMVDIISIMPFNENVCKWSYKTSHVQGNKCCQQIEHFIGYLTFMVTIRGGFCGILRCERGTIVEIVRPRQCEIVGGGHIE